MLEGSLLAGIAFANAGVTAVHAFAYPLGGEFHLAHGLANSVMLPHVMRFNLLGNLPKFADIGSALGLDTEHLTDKEAALEALEAIEDLMEDLNIPRRLRDLNIPQEAIPASSRRRHEGDPAPGQQSPAHLPGRRPEDLRRGVVNNSNSKSEHEIRNKFK